ncbi:MAG: YcaQ family DNA glycosylase [Opitutae bacterium]|nr:YcaQ family DNA glycosylase [Opitutae bacterium]
MPNAVLALSVSEARRFMRSAVGLDAPTADIGDALEHLGYVQIDPINVCGRMHDLILRNRVADYREGALHAFLHGPKRPGFEHFLPEAGILVAFPRAAWPYLLSHMRRRQAQTRGYLSQLSATEEKLAQRILAEIAARGPLLSDDIDDDARAQTAWGLRGRAVKGVLEKLFAHGRVLLSSRRNFRRVYDLPERVLPAATLASPEPSPEECARWLVLTRLRQRRLAWLKKAEVPFVADLVQPVRVGDGPVLHLLREDLPLLERVRGEPDTPAPSSPLLLAPLDPLIYDRRVTRSLWKFDYTWEVYTPAAKRVRGYYALPVLAGCELAGHVDPKADRARGRLVVVSRKVRRGVKAADAVSSLARFLGLR